MLAGLEYLMYNGMFFRIMNLKIWEFDPILIPMESGDQNESPLALYRERRGPDEKFQW